MKSEPKNSSVRIDDEQAHWAIDLSFIISLVNGYERGGWRGRSLLALILGGPACGP